VLNEELPLTLVVEEPEIVLVSPTSGQDLDSIDTTAGCVPSYCVPYCRI